MADLKGGLEGAVKYGTMGAAAGPYGALAGAVGGGLYGLFSGGDDGGGAPANAPYSPNPANFNAPSGGAYFNPSSGKAGGYWANQAGAGDAGNEDRKYVDWNRREQRSARGQQEAGLSQLGQYASGAKSAARKAAALQQEQTMAAIQSRMASTPGGWNPALQATGYNAISGAGQNLAGTAAAAASKEQLQAQKAYLQATGQMRGQDITAQSGEQQWYMQQQAAQNAYQNMKAKYLALGLQEKDADRRAKMEYEKMKFLASEGAAGRSLTQQQITNQQSNANQSRQDNFMMGGMGAYSGYQQQKAKENQQNQVLGGPAAGYSGGTPDSSWWD